ncbi:hypothetical protein [Pseudorhodobacter antarcticus]|nr:hypothetical protein [Pseudorhodobacter antarcticus]
MKVIENPQTHANASRFLFGKDIQRYLLEVRNHAGKMKMYQSILADLELGEERTKNVRLQHDHNTWLTDQLNPLFDKFEPFLGFGKHR